ncbi:MAG TPA: SDR family NAD(P)-dependent oxidoreductase, partial [Candidatus Elarobacter sp.]|nr:SDR family NAD(P)-dependent oxidoreductase [Candidatus Elarobacter sp.]
MLLEGDAIVLAGATGRVGGATLATLVHEGARVIVVSRAAERAREAIDGILDDAERAAAVPFAADLSDPAQALAAVDACVERFGRVDAVVSLAGEGRVVRLADSTITDLRENVAA